MKIDIGTLAIVSSIINLLQFIAIFIQWRLDKTHHGPGWWTLGTATAGLAYAFTYLRLFPQLASIGIVSNNLLFVYSIALIYTGLLRFLNQRMDQRAGFLERSSTLISFLAVFSLLDIYLTYINDDIVLRRAMIYLVCAALLFIITRAVLRYKTRTVSTPAYLIAAVTLIYGVVFIIGTLFDLLTPPDAGLLTASPAQVMTLLGGLIATTLTTFAFILMVNQRLGAENRESRENLELILNTSPDSMAVVRFSDGRFVEINDGFTTLSGYTRADALGRSSAELNMWQDPADRTQIDKALEETGFCQNREVVFRRKDGGPVIGLFFAKVINLQGVPHIISVTHDITGRKRAEEALRESGQRYERAVRGTTDGIWDWNIQTGEDYHSPRYKELLGYAPDEIPDTGEAFDALVHPDDFARMKAAQKAHLEQDMPYNVELRMRTRSGDYKWFVSRGQAERDEQGRPVRVSGSISDITERKRSDEALRESEEKHRVMFRDPPDAYLIVVDGLFVDCNHATEVMLGGDRTQIIGCAPHDLSPEFQPGGRKSSELEIEKINRTLRVGNDIFEWVHRRFDGTDFTVEVSSAAMTLNGSHALFIAWRDITERKLADAALRASERLYHDMFDNMSAVKLMIDPLTGVIVKVNQAAASFYGWPADVLETMNLNQINTGPEEQINAAMSRIINLGSSRFETQHCLASGEIRDVEVYVAPIEVAGRKLLLSIVHDITDRKKAEAALLLAHAGLEQRVLERTADLQAANTALERASRAKDEFLAIMSHELRTPLTGILGLAQVMQFKSYGEMNEKQAHAVQNIEKSGQHLLELINEILDFSRLQSGKLELQLAPCSLAGICSASLQMVNSLIEKKKQDLRFSIQPENIILNVEERRICQVIINLLSNAIKFTPDGGRIELAVSGIPAAQQVRISITDTGIGIKEEDLPRLFLPFQQLDTSLSRRYSGTGLGLSLVKNLVEMHGGSVEVESVFGQGSRFTVILPWQA